MQLSKGKATQGRFVEQVKVPAVLDLMKVALMKLQYVQSGDTVNVLNINLEGRNVDLDFDHLD